MHFTRSYVVVAIASILSIASADTNSTCLSWGIDYQDGGSYFINIASNESFTSVSQFSGCNPDEADVWFVPPGGDEIECSTMPTTPDFTNEISTCPVLKSQLVTGDYSLIIFGNNGDSVYPYAYERDFHLDVGTQVTTTVTPTLTFSVTTVPVETTTQTSTVAITSTMNATTTVTIPALTAPFTKTVLPKPTTVSTTKTITWTRTKYQLDRHYAKETKTAVCIVPTRPARHDPIMHYQPKKFHPKALQSGKIQNRAIKQRRSLVARTPDAPTVTVTASPPVDYTQTVTGPAVTNTASVLTTTTLYTVLPASTVKTGTYTITTTLPTPTRTRVQYTYTVVSTTKTIEATQTYTTTITPLASKEACKSAGGHFGGRW